MFYHQNNKQSLHVLGIIRGIQLSLMIILLPFFELTFINSDIFDQPFSHLLQQLLKLLHVTPNSSALDTGAIFDSNFVSCCTKIKHECYALGWPYSFCTTQTAYNFSLIDNTLSCILIVTYERLPPCKFYSDMLMADRHNLSYINHTLSF